jgi:hypothetical protein
MPNGNLFLYGFAGEYPWATPYNTYREERDYWGRYDSDFISVYNPSWNQVVEEWEYDASISSNFHIIVPARIFFSTNELWWNGKCGYCYSNGRTIFQDPSILEFGPSSLLVDAKVLTNLLQRLNLKLLWTLLGEKWILGGSGGTLTPQRTFSQVAFLDEDGSLKIGDRVFFDDYKQDTGPQVVKNIRSILNETPKRRKGAIDRSNKHS